MAVNQLADDRGALGRIGMRLNGYGGVGAEFLG
jgi:hypothetical protein